MHTAGLPPPLAQLARPAFSCAECIHRRKQWQDVWRRGRAGSR